MKIFSYPQADKNSPQIFIRLKKINKCFSGHFFEKQMRQAGRQVCFFLLLFPKKQMRPFFLFFILSNPNEAPFFVHFKHKNVDILILTSE